MGYHNWVNPRHVFMAPSKNICALFKESDKILLRLLPHTCPNLGKLLRVGLVQRYIFQYLNWLSQCSSFSMFIVCIYSFMAKIAK